MVQMLVEGGRKEENLCRAIDRIGAAAASGAQLVVLPEAMTLGWTHSSAKLHADEIPDGDGCLRLREAARQNRIYVCAGLIERAGPRIFNSAVLIGPDGDLLLHHRKLNELGIAHPCYALGDRLAVASTPLGTLGVMICADAFVRGQVVSRTLGLMGAEVILSPCAWAVPADHDNAKEPYGQLWLDNYCPVARDFRLWIVGVSNVGWINDGPWKGRKCIGCSLMIGPDGRKVSMGPYGAEAEAIVYADIRPVPRPASGDGWEQLWDEDNDPGRHVTDH